jgi:hypothetical protein
VTAFVTQLAAVKTSARSRGKIPSVCKDYNRNAYIMIKFFVSIPPFPPPHRDQPATLRHETDLLFDVGRSALMLGVPFRPYPDRTPEHLVFICAYRWGSALSVRNCARDGAGSYEAV